MDAKIELLRMVRGYVRTVRRGRKLDLVAPAAELEGELDERIAELEERIESAQLEEAHR